MRVIPTYRHARTRLNELMQTVLLYGNSLVVSSIGASLQGCPELQVLTIDPATPDAKQRLSALQPDIVIFDLATAQPDFAIALWKARPGLLLIGVDLTTDQALVLSSHPTRVLTTDDLLQVIQHNDPGSPLSGGAPLEPGQN